MGEPVLISEGIPDLDPMPGRSVGPHVSEAVNHLCVKLGHYQADSEVTREVRSRWELGNAFEEAVIAALRRRWVRYDPDRYSEIGELELDGVYGTPDLYDCVDDVIIEIKLTWLSAAHEPDGLKFWKYWTQVKAYCWMLGVGVGRLHVGHVNGDYREERAPIYRVWEREFTDRELEDNWKTIHSTATKLWGAGKE